MTLSYEAGLDDFAEPVLRHFFRGSTARGAQIRSTVIGALIMGVAACYVARHWGPGHMGLAALGGAVVGAALNYFTYRGSSTKRIHKYLKKQLEGRLPAQTVYSIEPGHISCACLGTTTTFSLSDLESLTEDERYMELSFGKTGICTIPLRAFMTSAEKEAFKEAIRREQGGLESGRTAEAK